MKISNDIEFFGQRSDAVTKQYEALPYPPFEESELNGEEQFYEKNNYDGFSLKIEKLVSVRIVMHPSNNQVIVNPRQ